MDPVNSTANSSSLNLQTAPTQEGTLEGRKITPLKVASVGFIGLGLVIAVIGVAAFLCCGPLSLIVPIDPVILFCVSGPLMVLGIACMQFGEELAEEDNKAYRAFLKTQKSLANQATSAPPAQKNDGAESEPIEHKLPDPSAPVLLEQNTVASDNPPAYEETNQPPYDEKR